MEMTLIMMVDLLNIFMEVYIVINWWWGPRVMRSKHFWPTNMTIKPYFGAHLTF